MRFSSGRGERSGGEWGIDGGRWQLALAGGHMAGVKAEREPRDGEPERETWAGPVRRWCARAVRHLQLFAVSWGRVGCGRRFLGFSRGIGGDGRAGAVRVWARASSVEESQGKGCGGADGVWVRSRGGKIISLEIRMLAALRSTVITVFREKLNS